MDATDALGVFTNLSTESTKFSILPNQISGSSASFIGEVTGEPTTYYAYYPYGSAKMSGTTLTLDEAVKAVQPFCANGFAAESNPSVAYGNSDVLQFRNLCGLVKFKVTGTTLTKVVFRGNNDENISGKGTVEMNYNDAPVLTITNEYGKIITLTGGTAVADGTYYIVVPAMTFSKGFTLALYGADGKVMQKKTSQQVTISRSKAANIGTFVYSGTSANYIPDANFRKKLEALGYGSTADSEAGTFNFTTTPTTITALDLNRCDIYDLSGIQYFTALETLNLTYDHLSQLDLSKNTALTYLTVWSNQLTQLDLSKNTALIYLWVSYNKLTDLDISKCLSLKTLSLDGNNLTSVDLSKYTLLEKLYVGLLPITEFDLSKNTALKEFYCSDNNVTNLDLSHNPDLTILHCFRCKLTSLDLSHQTGLQDLDCDDNAITSLDVSLNTSLTRLLCSGNSISELDVSKNTGLEQLECSRNNISELDVSKHTALRGIVCGENKLTKLNLSANTNLTEVQCEKNQITELYLPSREKIMTLICYGNRLTEIDLTSTTFHYNSWNDYNFGVGEQTSDGTTPQWLTCYKYVDATVDPCEHNSYVNFVNVDEDY